MLEDYALASCGQSNCWENKAFTHKTTTPGSCCSSLLFLVRNNSIAPDRVSDLSSYNCQKRQFSRCMMASGTSHGAMMMIASPSCVECNSWSIETGILQRLLYTCRDLSLESRADGTFTVVTAPTQNLCIEIQDNLCNILRRYSWLVSYSNAVLYSDCIVLSFGFGRCRLKFPLYISKPISVTDVVTRQQCPHYVWVHGCFT